VSSFLVGLGLGLVVAAQIGPVSRLIVRSVVRGDFRTGLAMAAAVSLVDLSYAALGLAGVARALEHADGVRLAFGFVGAAVLAAIGLRAISLRPRSIR
jgi:putative LysE/RhtB family amino acid efflux pump